MNIISPPPCVGIFCPELFQPIIPHPPHLHTFQTLVCFLSSPFLWCTKSAVRQISLDGGIHKHHFVLMCSTNGCSIRTRYRTGCMAAQLLFPGGHSRYWTEQRVSSDSTSLERRQLKTARVSCKEKCSCWVFFSSQKEILLNSLTHSLREWVTVPTPVVSPPLPRDSWDRLQQTPASPWVQK